MKVLVYAMAIALGVLIGNLVADIQALPHQCPRSLGSPYALVPGTPR